MNKLTSKILKLVIRKSNQRLLIPFYHAVTDSKPDFIGELYLPRKIDDFERDLDVLLELYEPISLHKLIAIVKSEEKIKKNYFHLTFDDGLANFYEIVAPILIKRNIPATVFLNTNFVDNKELFYRYKASLLLNFYLKSNEVYKDKFIEFIKLQTHSKKSVESYLMSVSFTDKLKLDDLAIKVGFSFVDFLKKERPYLTKNQIKELIRQGFMFGSHSMNHPYYKEIPLQHQIKETELSIKWIEDNLNLTPKVFAFPFTDSGVSSAYFSQIFTNETIELSFGTAGLKFDKEKFNVQRVDFEIGDKKIVSYLFKEYLKFYLKRLIGKHIVKRN